MTDSPPSAARTRRSAGRSMLASCFSRHVVARTVASACSGMMMWAAFPPRDLWFLAVMSLALLAGALGVGRPSMRVGAWCGGVFGLAFYLPLLPWIGVYVGALPWVALSFVLALYSAIFGVIATSTMRLPAAPLWFALSWVTVEWARSSFPFGGFPWGRAAFSQVNSPLLPIAALGGVPGLSFALALTGAAFTWIVHSIITRITSGADVRRTVALSAGLMLLGPVCAAAMWVPVHDADRSSDSITVAAIQGNVPRLGLDFNAQRRAVLDNHIRETMRLADRVRTGAVPHPDIVLWPENASDIDPTANSDAAAEISEASAAIGAPILVGTLVNSDTGVNAEAGPTNSVLVWDANKGIVGRYDKHIIQPFGEYLPWRAFFRLFSSYADQAGHFRAGHGPSVVHVAITGHNPVTVGLSTCWEVAFDRSARDAVDSGATFLAVPTNNATFGRTEMTYQQLAMSQVRAVEHGRSVVVPATTGVSAIIAPDGSIIRRSHFFEPAVLESRIVLRGAHTPATAAGAIPEIVAVACTLCGFAVAIFTRFRRGNRDTGSSEARQAARCSNEIDTRSTAPSQRAPCVTAKEIDVSGN